MLRRSTAVGIMVILASNSARRKDILKEIIAEFTVIPSDADESVDKDIPVGETVKLLALKKAKAVYETHKSDVVIGADTVVYFNGEIFGKPKDERDAKRMLRALSGNTHEVYTGFAVVDGSGTDCEFVRTEVTFNDLSDEKITEYVNTGIPMDKAGAYGIQSGYDIVKSYSGSYTNIVGLPKERLTEVLKTRGVLLWQK